MKTASFADAVPASLRAAAGGLLLAVLTILFGQGLGLAFGFNEAALKARLKSSALAVRATAYQNDEAAIKPVLDKSWTYLQRAHLHAGGLGTTAVGLIVLVCLLGPAPRMTTAVSLSLGAGGLGYSVFWLWAGFRAPVLGSTGAAKESLRWLGMPASGAFVLATVAVLGLLIVAMVRGRTEKNRTEEK